MGDAAKNLGDEKVDADVAGLAFSSLFSFLPLIQFWQEHPVFSADNPPIVARNFFKELRKHPELLEPIEDPAIIENNREIIDYIMSAVFPPASWEHDLVAVVRPSDLVSFYASPMFRNLFLDLAGNFKIEPLCSWATTKLHHSFELGSVILDQQYNIDVNIPEIPVIMQTGDLKSGDQKYYELSFDTRFINTLERGTSARPNPEDIQLLLAAPHSMENWSNLMLPESFEVEGFVIVRAKDVTKHHLESNDRSAASSVFSAMHPAISWKFRELSLEVMADGEGKLRAEAPIVRFNNVFPLFGGSEIRGVADLQKKALQSDLVSQITYAIALLGQAYATAPMPMLMEIQYRLGGYLERISKPSFILADELALATFIAEEVVPAFAALRNSGKCVEKIDDYDAQSNAEMGGFFAERRQIQSSFDGLVNGISFYLRQQQDLAQESYPHYFSRNLREGIQYKMFIGQTISPNKNFSNFHIRNLRLWQLQAMCGCVLTCEIMKSTLEIPLSTAHWIAVHGMPIGIRFDNDENQFVSDEYTDPFHQLIKDADRVKGHQAWEKIIEPGKITILFTDHKEKAEYLEFTQFLIHKGILKTGVEEGEVNGLVGLNSMKFLKVKVSLEGQSKKK